MVLGEGRIQGFSFCSADLKVYQVVVPSYSIWLAYSTFSSARSGMAGLSGSGERTEQTASKRQQKIDKRGGQKVQYR